VTLVWSLLDANATQTVHWDGRLTIGMDSAVEHAFVSYGARPWPCMVLLVALSSVSCLVRKNF